MIFKIRFRVFTFKTNLLECASASTNTLEIFQHNNAALAPTETLLCRFR